MIALAWWVLEKTGSATAMGVVLICSTLPLLLFLLFGGVAVDRLPRVRLMLVADVVRGVVVGLIAVLAFLQKLELWQLCFMSAIFGTVQAFFYPAYAALIPDIVPGEMLSSANALRSMSLRIAGLIGPAIAAAMIALGGTSLAFALDGLSFVISAICLVALPPLPATSYSASRETGMLYDIRAGISVVIHSPWLWITLVIAGLSTIFLDGPLETALPLLVRQRFGNQVGLFALLTTLSALGSISAALCLGHFKRLRQRGLLTYGSWVLASLLISVIGLPLPALAICVAVFILGAAISTLGLTWTNTLQEFVPSELLGRVASIDLLVSSGLLPVGYGLVGIAADRLGASLVFIFCGAIAASVIAVGLLHPAIRAVD